MKINLIDLVNDVFYAIQTIREDSYVQSISPGCDCGCGGDTFDFDVFDEAYKDAIATLKRYKIEVVE